MPREQCIFDRLEAGSISDRPEWQSGGVDSVSEEPKKQHRLGADTGKTTILDVNQADRSVHPLVTHRTTLADGMETP